MFLDQPITQFHYQQIIRQISSTREGVTLEISPPGLLILKYFTNKPHQSITKVYQIISVNHFKLAFKPKDTLLVKHYDLVQKIQNFIETFCFLRIGLLKHSSYIITMIRKKIGSTDQLIGIENTQSHNDEKMGKAIIFAKRHKQIIHKILMESNDYQREDLVYPLNKYISNAIQATDNPQFIKKLVQTSKKQLEQHISSSMQKTDNMYMLNIQRIQPYFDGKDHHSGIQFTVQGKSSNFIRLFNFVSEFFANLNYLVRPIKEIYCWKECQVENKLKKIGISAFLLNQTHIVMLQPPPNIDDILINMQKRQWILTAKHFLYSNFATIKLHQLSLISRFHQLKIQYQNLKIEEDELSLICTRSNYRLIEKVCKQFLRDMIFEQEQMTIFRNEMEVNIFKKYFIKKIMVDSRLQWRQGKAYLHTFHKNACDVYNQICKLYNSMRKNIVSIPVTKKFQHPLVRVSSNFKQSTIHTSCLYKQTQYQIYFHIRSISSIYNEGFGIYLITETSNNVQLIFLLKQNNISIDFYKTENIIQILTEKSLHFNSIFIWKISNKEGELLKSTFIQSGVLDILQKQKQIKLIFPEDSDELFLQFFQQFYNFMITNAKALTNKSITIFLPYLLKQKQQKLMLKINKLFKQLKIKGISRYCLAQKDILRLSVWTYVRLQCWNQKRRQLCSPLNSYLFFKQVRTHKFAIFLTPNIRKYTEYLVDLYSYQVYQILPFQINKISKKQKYIKPVVDIGKVIKSYLCNQNYILVYRDNDTKQLLKSDLFVIQKQALSNNLIGGQGKMIKYEIQLELQKIVTCNRFMYYKYQQIESLNKYKLETYRQFLPSLLKIMENSYQIS